MRVVVCATKEEAGRAAAAHGAGHIREAIRDRGEARILVATGLSQIDLIAALVAASDLDWGRVTGFNLDEYVGLPDGHPGALRTYLRERLLGRVPFREFHLLEPGEDPGAECRRMGRLIDAASVDVAFIGIGENGHLAFNDPPADFRTQEPYIQVELDEACRRQQFGEGWFRSLEEVPRRAVSISIARLMRSRAVICTAPERRKAGAVRAATEGPVTPQVPASILQRHAEATLFLDPESASLLAPGGRHVDSPFPL